MSPLLCMAYGRSDICLRRCGNAPTSARLIMKRPPRCRDCAPRAYIRARGFSLLGWKKTSSNYFGILVSLGLAESSFITCICMRAKASAAWQDQRSIRYFLFVCLVDSSSSKRFLLNTRVVYTAGVYFGYSFKMRTYW